MNLKLWWMFVILISFHSDTLPLNHSFSKRIIFHAVVYKDNNIKYHLKSSPNPNNTQQLHHKHVAVQVHRTLFRMLVSVTQSEDCVSKMQQTSLRFPFDGWCSNNDSSSLWCEYSEYLKGKHHISVMKERQTERNNVIFKLLQGK